MYIFKIIGGTLLASLVLIITILSKVISNLKTSLVKEKTERRQDAFVFKANILTSLKNSIVKVMSSKINNHTKLNKLRKENKLKRSSENVKKTNTKSVFTRIDL